MRSWRPMDACTRGSILQLPSRGHGMRSEYGLLCRMCGMRSCLASCTPGLWPLLRGSTPVLPVLASPRALIADYATSGRVVGWACHGRITLPMSLGNPCCWLLPLLKATLFLQLYMHLTSHACERLVLFALADAAATSLKCGGSSLWQHSVPLLPW